MSSRSVGRDLESFSEQEKKIGTHPQRLAHVCILDVLPPETDGAAPPEGAVRRILVQEVPHNHVWDNVTHLCRSQSNLTIEPVNMRPRQHD